MTAADQETILELKDVKKYFPIRSGFFQRKVGDIKAVDGVSFSLKRGETLGIVGESGCGKSTAGRTMIRLYKPTDGRILFKGQDISGLSEEKLRKSVRKNIQMVFQDPFASLNPRKTLRSIIKEPFQTHHMYSMSERNERVEELLAKVGLHPSFANRYPHEFSGGQRQRIGIARALTLNPELIIADEPVSALDVSIQAQVINLMEELQDEFNLTYLFISHDLSVVRHISDRVGVMYLGKMMELTDKHELYGNPLHPYTQALLSSVPVTRKKDAVKRERIILKGELPSPANPPKGCVFHTRCPMAKPICKEQVPAFEEAAPGHYVACHLYA
ncbi:dipeptide ABC transporter ATP-binding protein [Bacillus velezensis]|uniref:ABC transporter ATP-binding protein n=1 Tax=Bacillus velezensis TaxID=492670 RepID=UPI000EFB81C0|nr:dipeptide ABC transporter ATP-binding protein [Bacillus velezensis]MEC3658042.1 dipeptide ABC transporter ATP-binding protein [Bacillus velezensis]MEC3685729.1 dipeptide ABC transporter ATP-binding protein [Bacillus velezensis]MEC3790331.1 dipeptide ABC transporter ATP-binding protein [Bacillus velezensis]TWO89776.1 dipeptide ABC transporter ATP-binding protein [Bacillus velezensis]